MNLYLWLTELRVVFQRIEQRMAGDRAQTREAWLCEGGGGGGPSTFADMSLAQTNAVCIIYIRKKSYILPHLYPCRPNIFLKVNSADNSVYNIWQTKYKIQ